MLRTDDPGASEFAGRPRIAPSSNRVHTPAVPAAAGTAPTGSALARCVGIPIPEFADRYWSAAPLLTPNAGAVTIEGGAEQGFVDLFSTGAVDELVSRRGLRT